MAERSTHSITDKLLRIERFFAEDVALFKRQLSEIEMQIDPQALPCRDDPIHRQLQQAFEQSQDACRRFESENGDDVTLIQDAQEGFRKETDLWFAQSWIASRARNKPSGFPGDYDMLLKLYAQTTPARGIGGYLDLCIQDLPLARGVRTRLKAARQFLLAESSSRAGTLRIFDVACGPCQEYRDWPESAAGCRLDVVAIDSDPQALAYVDAHVATQFGHRLRTARYNALRTRSASATKRMFGTFDIVYSVGLCDYLSDEHLIEMFRGWRESLHDNGVLYVAFKDATAYDKTPYQWHLDWFFFQRNYEAVLRLYERAGFDVDGMAMQRDETQIMMNFCSRHATTRPFKSIDVASHQMPSSPSVEQTGTE